MGGLVHHTHGREGVMRTHNEKDPAELSDGPHQAHHRGGNGDEATDDDECCPRHIAAPCEDSIPFPRDRQVYATGKDCHPYHLHTGMREECNCKGEYGLVCLLCNARHACGCWRGWLACSGRGLC